VVPLRLSLKAQQDDALPREPVLPGYLLALTPEMAGAGTGLLARARRSEKWNGRTR
jgi:hypothetical protein